jgi:predicted ArsR family transcriptional regulator
MSTRTTAKLLKLLASSPRTANELAVLLEIKIETAREHLTVLHEEGVARPAGSKREGRAGPTSLLWTVSLQPS